MTPTVQHHAVHLEYLVADLQAAVLEGAALRVEAADEDAHLGSVAVAREADAQPGESLLQVHQQGGAIDVAVLLFDFFCVL